MSPVWSKFVKNIAQIGLDNDGSFFFFSGKRMSRKIPVEVHGLHMQCDDISGATANHCGGALSQTLEYNSRGGILS